MLIDAECELTEVMKQKVFVMADDVIVAKFCVWTLCKPTYVFPKKLKTRYFQPTCVNKLTSVHKDHDLSQKAHVDKMNVTNEKKYEPILKMMFTTWHGTKGFKIYTRYMMVFQYDRQDCHRCN